MEKPLTEREIILHKRRLFLLLLALSIIYVIFTIRLFWLQTSIPIFSDQQRKVVHSVKQRQQSIVLDSGRGHFYDRNYQPITGNIQQVIIVFPLTEEEQDHFTSDSLLEMLQVNRQVWENFRNSIAEPTVWRLPGTKTPYVLTDSDAARIRQLNEPGIVVVPYQMRYQMPQPAVHLIGFTGENPQYIQTHFQKQLEKGLLTIRSKIGVFGLEKSFEEKIRSRGALSVSRFMFAHASEALNGLGLRLHMPENMFYPLKVITTLDLNIQTRIEQLMETESIKEGAIVVLDVNNADIVAMASRPVFHPTELQQWNWENKALSATAPGSVFKTVIAAAALDQKVAKPEERFFCSGYLGKYKFKCWERSGHQWITFRQAYAKSCNITFANIMQRLTSADVERIADRLGLLQPIGWTANMKGKQFTQLDGEESGSVFQSERHKKEEGARIQTAIGQRDVRISPLHAANLVVTLLGDGIVKRPRIVSEIRYKDGSVKERFHPQHLSERAVSPQTARLLTEWMKDTVYEGTGIALQKHAETWTMAGKSGTAQVMLNGRQGENQWFIGYGPVEKPKFAVAVLVQGNHLRSGQAIDLFGKTMQILSHQADH